MTPALDLLKKVRAEHRIHSYEHDPKAASYGLEAAEKLSLDPAQVFKTLLASSEKGELLVAVVPVVGSLDLKAPRVICWAASARWGRRSGCARLSMKRRNPLQRFLSVRAEGVWKLNCRRRCWRNTPRPNSHRLAGPDNHFLKAVALKCVV